MLRLRLALNHYDRHVPFFDGSVRIKGVALRALDVGENGPPGRYGAGRHERMLQGGEFDAAELSLSSFLMAKDRGAPLTAIPVFPRRLFSLSLFWRRTGSPVRSPRDLAGRRVGLNTFQTTLSVLAKADLMRSYGMSWREVRWVAANAEVVPFELPRGVSLERAPAGSDMAELLRAGEIDALIVPHPPAAVLDEPETFERLVADARDEELRYFRTHGYYPIMHLVAFRDEVLREAPPDLPLQAVTAFERAWDVCRGRWDDPNWSCLAWGRQDLEVERRLLGPEAWANGIRRNRDNLEWFIEQERDQGLVRGRLRLEDLFHPSTLDS